jgi:hypothetical protein
VKNCFSTGLFDDETGSSGSGLQRKVKRASSPRELLLLSSFLGSLLGWCSLLGSFLCSFLCHGVGSWFGLLWFSVLLPRDH